MRILHTEREIIMSTNGYEIRLELLKMAKEMLEQDWHAQRDAVMTDYGTKVSFAHMMAENSESKTHTIPLAPTFKPFPTETEIIAKARVLNEFINQRQ
jgi:hypothetical protein